MERFTLTSRTEGDHKVILLLTSLFFLGGTLTKIDDFLILLLPLAYLLIKNNFQLPRHTIISCLFLFAIFFIGGIRRDNFEMNAFLVTFSITYSMIALSSINVYRRTKNFYLSRMSVITVWGLISIYCLFVNLSGEPRISSPGVYLFGDVSDSHIFSAQYAILSALVIILAKSFRGLFIVISIMISVLIGSRSGIFLLGIFVFSFYLRDINLKTIFIVILGIMFVGIFFLFSSDIFDISKMRALSIGTTSDTHRFQIIGNSLENIEVLDIFMGDDQAYVGERKYYDNFFISVFLLFGIVGAVTFYYELLSNVWASAPAYVFVLFIALLPLSDFLLIPRFQFIIFLLVLFSGTREVKYVHKN